MLVNTPFHNTIRSYAIHLFEEGNVAAFSQQGRSLKKTQ